MFFEVFFIFFIFFYLFFFLTETWCTPQNSRLSQLYHVLNVIGLGQPPYVTD